MEIVMNTSLSLKNLKAGDKVIMKTRRMPALECVFLGFSDDQQKYGEPGPVFATFAAVKKAKGYASFAAMDAAQEGKEYGFGIYAWFQEADADGKITTFAAYRYEGGWAIGSGAERISLEAK
jgi:hypothetical protein